MKSMFMSTKTTMQNAQSYYIIVQNNFEKRTQNYQLHLLNMDCMFLSRCILIELNNMNLSLKVSNQVLEIFDFLHGSLWNQSKVAFFPKITFENTHTIDSKTHQSLRKLYFHVVLSSWYCCRIPGRCTKYEQSSLVLK